jgi:hypothetical protein
MLAMAPKLWICAVLLGACSSPLARTAKTPERCAELDNRRIGWGAVSKGAAVLAGSSGLATVPLDDGALRTGVALTGVAMAALATASVFVAESSTESFDRECRNAGGQ